MSPTQLLSEFEAIGLLDQLSEETRAEVGAAVQGLDEKDPLLPLEVVAYLPGVAYLINEYGALAIFNNRERWDDLRPLLRQIVSGEMQPLFDQLWSDVEVNEESHSLLTALNEALAGRERDERFYHVMYADYPGGPYRSRAILFLTYSQFKALQEGNIFKLSASHAWSQARLDDFVDTLQELGLLSSLTDEQTLRVQQALLADYDRILKEMDVIVRFDLEMIADVEADYRRLLSRVLPLSEGVLAPEAVEITAYPGTANGNPEYVAVSFSWNGRRYSRKLAYHGDYVNNELFYLLNDALADQGHDGRFCLLETDDHTAQVIFLDGEQLREVKERNLLPLDEWFDV